MLLEGCSSATTTTRVARQDARFNIGTTHKYIGRTKLRSCLTRQGKTLCDPPYIFAAQARDRREAKARSLCDACTVQSICKEYARNNHEYGFWGGENEEQRHMAGYTVAAPIGIRARVAHSA